MFDLFFENAHIADGTGKAIYKSNVGVSDGKIAYIGSEQSYLRAHNRRCSGKIHGLSYVV